MFVCMSPVHMQAQQFQTDTRSFPAVIKPGAFVPERSFPLHPPGGAVLVCGGFERDLFLP